MLLKNMNSQHFNSIVFRIPSIWILVYFPYYTFWRSFVDCNQFWNGQQKTFWNAISIAIKPNIVYDWCVQFSFYYSMVFQYIAAAGQYMGLKPETFYLEMNDQEIQESKRKKFDDR